MFLKILFRIPDCTRCMLDNIQWNCSRWVWCRDRLEKTLGDCSIDRWLVLERKRVI